MRQLGGLSFLVYDFIISYRIPIVIVLVVIYLIKKKMK